MKVRVKVFPFKFYFTLTPLIEQIIRKGSVSMVELRETRMGRPATTSIRTRGGRGRYPESRFLLDVTLPYVSPGPSRLASSLYSEADRDRRRYHQLSNRHFRGSLPTRPVPFRLVVDSGSFGPPSTTTPLVTSPSSMSVILRSGLSRFCPTPPPTVPILTPTVYFMSDRSI